MTDLPPIERLQAVHLKPGDVLVATVPDDIDREGCKEVNNALKRIFCHNEVMVITSTLELAAYRPVENT